MIYPLKDVNFTTALELNVRYNYIKLYARMYIIVFP